MPAITTYSPTGEVYVDGLLFGTKWATDSFTFSFPTDPSSYGSGYGGGEPTNGFQVFNSAQQSATRSILSMYSSTADMAFAEIAETATQHADLRYAESNSPGTAWAYYPTSSAVGGDAWFNSSKGYYDSPVTGNYAWLTITHEIGHSLGLKHPHELQGLFGALALERDSLEYTVMSYRSYIGGSTTSGYTNGAYSYPQTLMMLDIAALQRLYGPVWTTNAGATVYSWSPATGEMFINGVGQGAPGGNKVFLTVWDGGGEDCYDFSAYSTQLRVDLRAGAWSTLSTAQLADLNAAYAPATKLAAGNVANALLFEGNIASLIENAIGGSGSDSIIGNQAFNRLTGGAGNDTMNGLEGLDTCVFSGAANEYIWLQNGDGSWMVSDLRLGSPDGSDVLLNIEFLMFADRLIDLGTPASVINSRPLITSPSQTSTLTEWVDQSADELANTTHRAAGRITYSDPDAGDSHSATVSPQGSGYLGSFTLDTTQMIDGGVGWSFSVSDAAMDFLASGQTLVQTYTVTIGDSQGGVASDSVTISLIGAADAVVGKTTGGKKVGTPGSKGKGAETTADAHEFGEHELPGPADVFSISGGSEMPGFLTHLPSDGRPQWSNLYDVHEVVLEFTARDLTPDYWAI
jgi:serralysin